MVKKKKGEKHLYRIMWGNKKLKVGGLLNPSQQYTHSPKRTKVFLKKARKSWGHPAFGGGSKIYFEKIY